MEEKSFDKSIRHRNFIFTTLILNIISIVFGTCYYIFRFYDYVSNVFGFVLLVTFLFNLILMLLYDRIELISQKTRSLLRILSVVYLVYALLAILMMLGGNVLVQITYDPSFKENSLGLLLNLGGFFGMLLIGTFFTSIATARILKQNREVAHSEMERSTGQKIGAIIGQVLCFLLLGLGIYTSITVLTGKVLWFSFLYITQYFIPECALFLGIFFLTATILAVRLIPKKNKVYLYAVLTIGLSISAIHVIPAVMTPAEIIIANNRYTAAFGEEWQSIPPSDEKFMTRSPFSLSRYFLGMHPNDYTVQRDILYYNGYADPKDENLTLFFDLYQPTGNRSILPGQNSTLIRFHGGGLKWYDKGISNMQKMNYYFASQGYVVFDVQYGLFDEYPYEDSLLTPAHVKGNFTIDDIMRHIGIFMEFLYNNSAEYGANLNSIFFSGGSAGGLLTCTTAYTLQHANYTFYNGLEALFDVKGIIPFYPWVQGGVDDINGSLELLTPYSLVDSSSVPCLIYQGQMDTTVEPEETQLLQDAYDDAGVPCATLPFYFAEHVSDMVFEGYFNQIFLYYMERFMYQHR